MSTTTLIIIAVIAVVIILVLRAMGESKGSSMPDAPATPTGPDSNLQSTNVRRIAQLMMEGKKIEAIKAYMEMTHVGLEEAKTALDRYDPIMQRVGLSVTDGPIADWSEIDGLIKAGNTIDAIRLYRQKTSCDLKEAKDVIDSRAAAVD